MKRRCLVFIWLILGVFLYVGIPESVCAAELHFTVKAILPENQTDKEKTHFDLRMQPNQEQTIEIEVTNTADKPIDIAIEPSTAVTNLNGVIDYPNPKSEITYDQTLKIPFSKIAVCPEKVSFQAKETKKIPIQLKMPSDQFDGIILGALRFSEIENQGEQSEESKTKGMGVRNRFDYLVGVRLSETDTEVKPEMKLLGVRASQVNYRNVVNVKLQNPQSVIINHLKINAKVYPSKSNAVAYEETSENRRMAPNSYYDYPIALGKKPFRPGMYRVQMTATDGQQTWKFSKEFEITKKEAEKYNEKSAVELEKQPNWGLYLVVGIGIILLLILLVIFLLYRNKKMSSKTKGKKKISKNRNKNKKKTKRRKR